MRIPLRTVQRSCKQFTGLLEQNPHELVEVVNAKGKVLFYAQSCTQSAQVGDVTGVGRGDKFKQLKEEYGDNISVISGDTLEDAYKPSDDWGA